MKNRRIKRRNSVIHIVVLSLILISTFSCSDHDPSITTIESYQFYNSGNNQNGFAGEYLKDSIVVGYNGTILNTDSNKNTIPQGIHVHFEVTSGNGSIDQPDKEIPSNGFVFAHWKMGLSGSNQLVTAYVYDKTGKLLSQLNFTAYAFSAGRWDVISNLPNGYLNDMARDTIHGKTFMIVGTTLCQQGVNYYNWEKVKGLENQNCQSVEIDKNGILYVGTSDGNLFKSNDQAGTFTECTKPIPDYSGYFNLSITSDNEVWVSRWNYPLRFSKDGGQSWILSQSGLSTQNSQAFDIFRLQDGHLIALTSNYLALYKSSDGLNWVPTSNTQKYIYKIFVTDENEIIALVQDDKMSLYKSVDGGDTFQRVYSVYASYITVPLDHVFTKSGGYYYVCIPGGKIVKTKDFNTFEVIWTDDTIRELMMDHNGVFFVTNKDFNKVYCYKR